MGIISQATTVMVCDAETLATEMMVLCAWNVRLPFVTLRNMNNGSELLYDICHKSLF